MRMPKNLRSFLSLQVSSWVFFFLFIALGCIYLLNIRPGHDWGDDFAAYIHHAKNIATGHSYGDIKFIPNPFHRVELRSFPPVFPFFLSIVYWFFGMNLFVMKIMVILFWQATLGMAFLLFRKRFSGVALFSLMLVIGIYPFLFVFLNNILSETTFLFFVFLSLYLAEYFYKNKLAQRGNQGFFVVLGAVIYLAYGTRAIGAVLIPALVVYDFVKHGRFHKETFLSVLTFCFFAIVQSTFGLGASDYLLTFGFHWATVLGNVMHYVRIFYFLNTPGFGQYLFLAKVFLGIMGFYIAIRRNLSPLEFFVFFYICVILMRSVAITSFDTIRFLVPLMPFYFYYVFLGAKETASLINKKFSNVIFGIFLAVIIGANVTSAMAWSRQNNFNAIGVSKKESIELFEYLKKNTNPQDAFIFIKPRTLTLFTDRPASLYYPHKDMQVFSDYLLRAKIRYIVIDKRGDSYLKEFVKVYNKQVSRIYENADFQVLKLLVL